MVAVEECDSSLTFNVRFIFGDNLLVLSEFSRRRHIDQVLSQREAPQNNSLFARTSSTDIQ